MKRLISNNQIIKYTGLFCLILLIAPVWNSNTRIKDHQASVRTDMRASWGKQKDLVLEDSHQRVAEDFQIPPELKKRVSFWFDIYSSYEKHHKVIHHSLYPWVVYEVVDARKHQNIDRYMKDRLKKYRTLFKSLRLRSKNKKEKFSKVEKHFLALFNQTSNPKRALRFAASKLRYQTGQKNMVKDGFARAQPFLPAMEVEFAKRGLPVELTRLPFVESSFHVGARSRVGAVGVWQFMRRTGRKFMRVNKKFDERLSPLKSTAAAAKLLRQNHKILYGEWPLAITAYNYGPSGLRRAVKKLKDKKLSTIIRRHRDERFSFASSNFYSCFLAILYVEKYKDQTFPQTNFNQQYPELAKVRVTKKVRAKVLLAAVGMDKKEFLHLNPELTRPLRRNFQIPKGYIYFVPLGEDKKVALESQVGDLQPSEKIHL